MKTNVRGGGWGGGERVRCAAVMVLAAAGILGLGSMGRGAAPAGDPGVASSGQPPSVVTDPVDVGVCAGGTATFSAVVSGAEPMKYQWRYYTNLGSYSILVGQTQLSLTLPDLEPSYGRVALFVTNDFGSVTTRLAKLTVYQPIVITQQLTEASLTVGQSVTLGLGAIGDSIAYQWWFEGAPLAGKTSRTLSLTGVKLSDAGFYQVVLSNLCGVTASAAVQVRVAEPVTFTRVMSSPWAEDVGCSFHVTVGDYDNDGFEDVMLARYRQGRSTLYHNNGDGTFRSVTNGMWPMPVGEFALGGCSDLDNDGWVDLVQLDWSAKPSFALFNNHDATFSGIELGRTYAVWGCSYELDYDRDGLLDIFVTQVDRNNPSVTNQLFRNLGGRRFQPMTSAEVGPILGRRTWGNAAVADYDDDGLIDVALPDFGNNSTRRCYLYRGTASGRFVAVTNQFTQTEINGLTAFWGDYDNDGRVDLAVSGGTTANAVFRNLGNGEFARVETGIPGDPFYNGMSWGDYDNDGFLDLCRTYGNGTGNALYRNNGNGTFTVSTAPPIYTDRPTPGASYAATWFDYDNDGFLDLGVPTGDDYGTVAVPNFLYHNNGNGNAWLKVKLIGTVSNRQGAGAKVRVRATFAGATRWLRRDTTTTPGVPGMGPVAHFGLGDATVVELVRVEWPSGQVSELTDVTVRQQITVVEAPGLRAVEVTPAGMAMTVTAHPGMNVGMLVSTNLMEWVSWQTVAQTNRITPVNDPDAAQHAQRFYRARIE